MVTITRPLQLKLSYHNHPATMSELSFLDEYLLQKGITKLSFMAESRHCVELESWASASFGKHFGPG